ncbi:hypothetical protein OUZ56_019091 [Daphnia magna]|uniref:Uncharacterized protein n=1 Tax=Daphnia magna TaxID=35525 RepID=A0ABQ9ZAM3_9CRUS|nr:hypothetical protein OUZ56_019091 [Daphnia magna]
MAPGLSVSPGSRGRALDPTDKLQSRNSILATPSVSALICLSPLLFLNLYSLTRDNLMSSACSELLNLKWLAYRLSATYCSLKS